MQPWTEKYRPVKISDISAQEEVVKVLSNTKDLPHLLFYGPPGTGKTSAALALARNLYGQHYKQHILELNASDERGINIVREKIKNFSRTKSQQFKLVILDEADSMTTEAQAALRRMMEMYSRVTRFCLICNYVSRIIEPLASRCAKFRFKSLSKESSLGKLNEISQKEGLNIPANVLERLVELSGGDLRKSITLLQTCGKFLSDEKVLDDVAGVVSSDKVEAFLESCLNETALTESIDELLRAGYSPFQLVSQVFDHVLSSQLNGRQKTLIAHKLSLVEKCLMDGSSARIQLMDLGYFYRSVQECVNLSSKPQQA